MSERLFKGIRTKNGAFVTYEDVPLDLRLDLKEHSPMGFEWGYNGSGPKQLALAILAKVGGDEFSLRAYVEFSKNFIEIINDDVWMLDYKDIRQWMNLFACEYLLPTLTPRFKLINTDEEYAIYLDNNILGRKLHFTENKNTWFDDGKFYVYASFNEVSDLNINELPEKLEFTTFGPYGDGIDDNKVNNLFNWHSFEQNNGILTINFNLFLSYHDYNGYLNPKILIENFLKELERNFIRLELDQSTNEGDGYDCYFSLSLRDKENNLSVIFEKTINILLKTYDNVINNPINYHKFEATFNLPEEYQSILKPYMLYFEEFLHDLCIDSDVTIRKEGDDTILSVEPKNKDEALEKIANALKMYLSAPIVASNVELEQKLQMQVALQKLHAECSHMESQLLLKTAMLNTHQQQLVVHDEIISETKRILVEVGVNPKIITANNIIFLESLKEITFNNQHIKKKTFIESFKGKLKVAGLFETSIEVSQRQLENNEKDDK